MKRSARTGTEAGQATSSPVEPSGRLSGVRVVSLDAEERPSREDMTYGETIFNRGVVPLPRFLTGRRKRRTP